MSRVTSACRLAVGASAALAVAAAPAQAARTIERGDHGDAVRALQRALGQPPDGAFGPATKRAVVRFQRRHGLTADGVVGPSTWTAVLAARKRQSPLRSGSSRGTAATPRVAHRGSAVRALQRRLGLSADGVFGPADARAVKRFQARHGLTADGVVGPATWTRARRRRHATRPARRAHPHRRLGHRRGRRAAARRSRPRTGSPAALQVRRRPRQLHGHRLRLLGLGLLRPARRRAARPRRRTPASSCPTAPRAAAGYITIYANPGHAYMVIDGRRFDTSGDAAGRWQSDCARAPATRCATRPATDARPRGPPRPRSGRRAGRRARRWRARAGSADRRCAAGTRGASASSSSPSRAREVRDRADAALLPEQRVGERRDVAHVDPGADDGAAGRERAQRGGDERADRREDDRGVERLGRRSSEPPAQLAPSVARERLARVVARPREREHRAGPASARPAR